MAAASGARLRKRYRLATRTVAALTVAGFVLALWLAHDRAGARAYGELSRAAGESLAVQIEALTGVMEKYRLIPPLLSRRDDVRALFGEPDSQTSASMRGLLKSVAAASGARDIAIADMEGTVLVSARGLTDTETITRSGLPAVVAQRRLGRAALRLVDGSRAYAFASHIAGPDGHTNVGMVVVLVPFGAIEANWSLSSHPIFVSDANEIVFLSNRRDWVGRPWKGSEAAPGIEPLSFASGEFVRIPDAGNARFVEASRTIPILGWTLHVLVDSAPALVAGRIAAGVAGLSIVLAGMTLYLLLARRELAQSRMRREKAQSMRLERLVRDRTARLSEVNDVLRTEIDVRRQTEGQLRDTQDELVHAAKLAVIGQMSAGLTHEYNQPLAAIKMYAENGSRMIERGKTEGLPEIFKRIGQMVERMSALSGTLLAFSRKPGTTLAPTSIETVVAEALLLVRQKAKTARVAISTDIQPELCAHTGPLRLSQIIVNLVGNAVDALRGDGDTAPAGARVDIAAREENGRVLIEISDNGPGIAPDLQGQVFEPFFTTKPVGSGLGLGLSIVDSVVRDLQGTVRLRERPGEPGACFVIDLPAAEEQAQAAE